MPSKVNAGVLARRRKAQAVSRTNSGEKRPALRGLITLGPRYTRKIQPSSWPGNQVRFF
jgi:hypothetical protein